MHLCSGARQGLASMLRRALPRWFPPSGAQGGHRADAVAKAMMASLVMSSILHLAPGLFVPLNLPAFVVASHFATVAGRDEPLQGPGATGRLAIVAIDDGRFDREYSGTRPLDRCQLFKDLDKLAEIGTLKTIAIDFDLSPTKRAGGTEEDCQQKIDRMLDAMGPRAIVIEPTDPNHRVSWMNKRRASGVSFAQAELDQRFGMVTEYTAGNKDAPHLAELLGARVCPATDDGCAGRDAARVRKETDGEPFPVIYRALRYLYRGGATLAVDDPCLRSAAPSASCPGSPVVAVIVGGTYAPGGSNEDNFLTPIGREHGVRIHAAIAAQPRQQPPHGIVPFLFDALIGSIIGFALHTLWRRYFDQRFAAEGAGMSAWRRPAAAYLWLVGLVAFVVFVTLFAFMASAWAMTAHGVWIAPAALVVGMSIEAFVTGGVDSALKRLDPPAPTPAKGPLAVVIESLPCLAGVALVVAAIARGLLG